MTFQELTQAILAVISSLFAAGFYELISRAIRRKFPGKQGPQKAYAERLAELTESLTKASREVDSILSELSQAAEDRANSVKQLETDLIDMEGREQELRKTIEALEKTPLAVAEHFAKLVAPGERRSAIRDYLLFGAGVVVSTVVGIIIQILIK